MALTVSAAIAAFRSHLRLEKKAGKTSAGTIAFYEYGLSHLDDRHGEEEMVAIRMSHLLSCPQTAAFFRCVRRLFRFHELKEPSGLYVPREGQRRRVVEPSELKFLVRAASGSVPWMVRLQHRTGMRPEEVREVEWREVKERERLIKLTEFKAQGKRKDQLQVRLIPLPVEVARLFAWARLRLKPKPGDLVFRNRYGEPWTCNAYMLAIRRARRRANLEDEDEGAEQITPYTLRHTFATEYVRSSQENERPVDVTLLADTLGHTNVSTTRRYLHRTGRDLVRGLDAALGKRRKGT